MRSNYKPNFKNRPPHKICEDGFYFVTSRTVEGQWFLRPDNYKMLLLEIIHEKTKKYTFPLIAYVILPNHYHMIVNAKSAKNLPRFMREINGASSKKINEAERVAERKIWWNYFDKYLKDEKDFFTHLNYIHQNPIKHSESKDFEYRFSSFCEWVEKKGREYLGDVFEKYPIVDFKVYNDDF